MRRTCRVGVALVAMVAAGCSEEDASPLAILDESDTSTISLARPEEGVLSITDDCVTLSLNEVPREITLVWRSAQVVWDEERSVIRFEDPDDGPIELSNGQVVEVGGEGTIGNVPPDPPWLVEPAGSCPTDFFTVHDIVMG